ncbi:MAG TPA: DUF3040 domain-containing protein [Pseudonocardia sp.]|jgi:hypothetical protein|uniref:DUF3040 domain-containing protein n=1 Tax=Pseudonocardia sp. TaxID=60912 RepID=UPI002B4AC212|nr:DUF3040 domain-containing protein [Pseudonocardia sp.]HLU55991.1 DUF3040 domain-containing protein [Pseudonocardia sp.]
MLNQNERRRLEEIERRLQAEDPEFAQRFTRWTAPPSGGGGSTLLPLLLIVVGALGLTLSLLVALPAVFMLSLAATVGGGLWLRRKRRL